MTTVVLPPPAPAAAAAVVTSSSSKTSSSSLSVTTTTSSESACAMRDDNPTAGDVDAPEPEAEEKENDERDNNSEHAAGNVPDVCKSAVNTAMGEEPARSVAASKPAASATAELRYKKRPRVSFESADIVEFEPTIYTTTVTSGGIPVGMSFTERSRSRRRLDSWELERTDARVGRQSYMEEGYLDPTERESILNKTGYDDTTMVVVEAEVNRIIADRRESNEADFEFMYGLGEVDDSVVEDEDEAMNPQQLEEEDEEEDEDEEPQEEEEAGGESSAGGFSSEEEDENDRTHA